MYATIIAGETSGFEGSSPRTSQSCHLFLYHSYCTRAECLTNASENRYTYGVASLKLEDNCLIFMKFGEILRIVDLRMCQTNFNIIKSQF